MTLDQPYTVRRLSFPWTLRMADRMAGLAGKAGLQAGNLDPDHIIAAACRNQGHDDLGAETYRPFLDQFLEVCQSYPITHIARIAIRAMTLGGLNNRLRNEAYLTANPDALDLPVDRPIFIMGFPRTGTTLLQNLLSQEPGNRALNFWELYTPAPVHSDPGQDRMKRLKEATQVLKVVRFVAPETPIVHDVRPTSKEECWYLFANSMAVLNWDLQSGFSRWGDWLFQQDMSIPYQEYRRTLQLLAHWKPTGRFVLKCPEHMWFLDTLLDVFPDACIVWTHRDPVSVIPSYCSMISLTWRTWWGFIDPAKVGDHITHRFRLGMDRATAVRDRVGSDRFFDLNYEDLVADPVRATHNIHSHFGLPHSDRTDGAIRDFLEQPRTDKPGSHRYSAEQWCLEPDRVREMFADYIERFNVQISKKKRVVAA